MPKIVAHFEKINEPNKQGLEAWLVRQKGQPRTFTLEGVLLELENGDEYGVPFFFFSADDLRVLRPGWDEWLAAHDDYERREDHAFLLRSAAAARQRNDGVQREIARMQLNLQAVEAGVTSLWESDTLSRAWQPQSSAVGRRTGPQQRPGHRQCRGSQSRLRRGSGAKSRRDLNERHES